MHPLSLASLLREEFPRDNYDSIGKGHFLQWRKSYLSFEEGKGWSIVQLNLIDRIFRALLGLYPSTHLTFVCTKIKEEPYPNLNFIERMGKIWDNTYPNRPCPFINHLLVKSPLLDGRSSQHSQDIHLDAEDTTLDAADTTYLPNEADLLATIQECVDSFMSDEDIQSIMQNSDYSKEQIQALIDQARANYQDSFKSSFPFVESKEQGEKEDNTALFRLIQERVHSLVDDSDIQMIMESSHYSKPYIQSLINQIRGHPPQTPLQFNDQ